MPRTMREEYFKMYVVVATLNVIWIIALVWAMMDGNYLAAFLGTMLVASYSFMVLAGFHDVFGLKSRGVRVTFDCSKNMAEQILKAGKYYGAKDLEDSIILATTFMEMMVKEQTEKGKVILLFDKDHPEKTQIFGSTLTDKDIYEGLGLNDKDKDNSK